VASLPFPQQRQRENDRPTDLRPSPGSPRPRGRKAVSPKLLIGWGVDIATLAGGSARLVDKPPAMDMAAGWLQGFIANGARKNGIERNFARRQIFFFEELRESCECDAYATVCASTGYSGVVT
jgi:hypothetical protein